MRFILLLPLLILFSCQSNITDQEVDQSNKPPNVIIIMVDDMGFSDLGCYGGEIQTPNLDALAENGVRFTRFYNAARCCPSRASLLSGQYPHRAGMGRMVNALEGELTKGPYQGYLRQDSIQTIAQVLGRAGYKNYMSGKWHLGERPEHWPLKYGFDEYFGLISGASSYYTIRTDQKRVRQMVHNDQLWTPPAEDFYMTTAITDTAVAQINRHQSTQQDKPFFQYVAYTAPHWPLHAPEQTIEKYKGQYDRGWDSLRYQRFQKQLDLDLLNFKYQLPTRPESIPAWEDTPDKATWSKKMEVYAAMVDEMDQGVGKIITALKQNKQLDNTLILFLSDNGGCAESVSGKKLNQPGSAIGAKGSYVAYREPWAWVSNTPFRNYKKWTHEGGIATPLIAHWPNKIKSTGKITQQTGHLIDLLPTIIDATHSSYTSMGNFPLPGQSLLPYLISPEQRTVKRKLFWEHFDHKAYIEGDWKIVKAKDSDWELYDITIDRTEQFSHSQAKPVRLGNMTRAYEGWAEEIGIE